MEKTTQLNRVELIGLVGNIRVTASGGTKAARMTVATNLCYRSAAGEVVIETQWTQVTAFEGKSVSFDGLGKGVPVHVVGRLRSQRYTDADGNDRSTVEVVACSLGRIGDGAPGYETL